MNTFYNFINNFLQIKKYFKVVKNNTLYIPCYLKNSRINIKGKNNTLSINKGNIKRLKVGITGNNNILTIQENTMLRDINIIIEGENLKVSIGKNTEVGGVHLVCCGKDSLITIGENCLLASNIEIRNCDGHAIIENNKIINHSKSVIISDNIWICQNVQILKDVHIGAHSIIGLNALVTKGNYPENVILAGSPAKIIKENITWDKNRPD